jgi:hypothetical protein
VAEGLLPSEDLRYSRPGQEVVAKTAATLPARAASIAATIASLADELRQLADYAAEVDLDPSVVSELIKVGEEFLKAARDYVGPQER